MSKKQSIRFPPDIIIIVEEYQKKYRLNFSQTVCKIIEEHPKIHLELKKLEESQNHSLSNSSEENTRFPCNILCKRFPSCVNGHIYYLPDIVDLLCYKGRFPNKGGQRDQCVYIKWETHEHDAQNPYPTCLIPQRETVTNLPKDRFIRDPSDCWTCIDLRREKRQTKKITWQPKSGVKGDTRLYSGGT